MITQEESIPKKSDKRLYAEDIFYSQFNEVSFYVEDKDSENLYLAILKKLFDGLKIEKIFPLNGKREVIDKAKESTGSRNKVFILDKDFHDLLGDREELENLFYLRRYSIENYLLEEEALIEYVKLQDPKVKLIEILQKFSISNYKKDACELFFDLVLLFIYNQEQRLGIVTTKKKCDYYVNFENNECNLNSINCESFRREVIQKSIDAGGFISIDQILDYCRRKYFGRDEQAGDIFEHIPGKYLARYFKWRIDKSFDHSNFQVERFIYFLALQCKFESLLYLKNLIVQFIKGPSAN